MRFHSSTQIIIFIKRSSVIFLFKDGTHDKLALPPELVQNLEVLDDAKLKALFADFIKLHTIKNKHAIIILDEDTIFIKIVPMTPDMDIEKARTDFLEKVPFNTADRNITMLVKEKQIWLFAANRALYQPALAALEQAGNKVTAVTPATIYNLPKSKEYTEEQLSRLFEKNPYAKTADFLLKI